MILKINQKQCIDHTKVAYLLLEHRTWCHTFWVAGKACYAEAYAIQFYSSHAASWVTQVQMKSKSVSPNLPKTLPAMVVQKKKILAVTVGESKQNEPTVGESEETSKMVVKNGDFHPIGSQ